MVDQESLFAEVPTLLVEEEYTYTQWGVKDRSGKRVASVYRKKDGLVRCLTCERRMVGAGNACVHVLEVRRVVRGD